jgi:hypothetical protein
LSFNFNHIFCWGQAVGFHFRNTECVFSGFFHNILFCFTFIFVFQYCGQVYTSNQFCELTKWLIVVSLAFFLWKSSLLDTLTCMNMGQEWTVSGTASWIPSLLTIVTIIYVTVSISIGNRYVLFQTSLLQQIL